MVFWPAFQLNMIGNLSYCEGYQINMNTADTLIVVGSAVQPENTTCSIPNGWSIMSYLRQVPSDIVVMMSPIVNNVIIVKNSVGAVYWPAFNLNMIGNMIPGQGYQIKTSAAVTLTYPANPVNLGKFEQLQVFYQNPDIINTGNNMTLGLSTINIPTGEEIFILSQSGQKVGSASVIGKFTPVTIWGDDDMTSEIDGLLPGEEFIIQLASTGENIIVESWQDGDDRYETNKIAIASGVEPLHATVLQSTQFFQNYPNPFSSRTEFSFYLAKGCYVDFEIYNLLGKRVAFLISENLPEGKHTLQFNNKNLQAGTYYYRLRTNEYDKARRMVIIK